MNHFYQTIGENWFNYPVLYSSIVASAEGAEHFVEVGCWKGRSAAFMAVEIINSGKKIQFDCIDTWGGSVEHVTPTSPFYQLELANDKDWLYNQFLKNIEPVRYIVNPIRMSSLDGVKLYTDNSLDFVFIDASHEYEDVKADIQAWLPKVKLDGGIIAGHDYNGGVAVAVNEIFNSADIIDSNAESCWVVKL